MKLKEVVSALENFAPLSLQDSYDNAGLQIGLTEDADVTGALLCLDVTEDVIDEALEKGCNLIVSHHPLLFRPCKTITGADYVERCVMKAIKGGVAVYAAHTNLDNADGGVSCRMAEKLSLQQVSPLRSIDGHEGAGSGITGILPQPMDSGDFAALVKSVFKVDAVRYNSWKGSVKKVALCGGAGAFLVPDAIRAGADAFVTGEIGYHRFFGYEHDIMLLELGHFESERYTVDLLEDILAAKLPQLKTLKTQLRTNPINYK